MRVSKVALALAAFALVFGAASELWAGATIEEKPVFAPTDFFLTKAVTIPTKFKNADGSVLPAGLYSFRVQGTGKAGEVAIRVQNPRGQTVGNAVGKYRTMRPRPADGPRFDKLGFSSASPVQVKLEGHHCLVFFLGGNPGKGGNDSIWLDLTVAK